MKRLASVLALLGCILHATLLPWHAAYAKGAAVSEAQLAQDLLIICHGDGTGASSVDGAAQAPAEQQQQADCLVCKGLVGFQLMVLAAAEIGLLAPPPAMRFALITEAVGVDGISIAPRSRGPPLSV